MSVRPSNPRQAFAWTEQTCATFCKSMHMYRINGVASSAVTNTFLSPCRTLGMRLHDPPRGFPDATPKRCFALSRATLQTIKTSGVSLQSPRSRCIYLTHGSNAFCFYVFCRQLLSGSVALHTWLYPLLTASACTRCIRHNLLS